MSIIGAIDFLKCKLFYRDIERERHALLVHEPALVLRNQLPKPFNKDDPLVLNEKTPQGDHNQSIKCAPQTL